MDQGFNTRILVIDDDEGVRESFRKILQPDKLNDVVRSQFKDVSNILFDNNEDTTMERSSATFEFDFNEASNGKQGYEMIKAAVEETRPYAAVFVDMRMPGWDGLETVTHIRKIDKRCEIIFVTAYSDYSIKEIVTSVGTNISYHCKPFSIEEIEQIATKAVYEWNKTSNLEDLIKTISVLRAQKWQMAPLLENILQQVSYLMGTHSAMIALKKSGAYEKLLAIGNLCDDSIADSYLDDIAKLPENEVFQNEKYVWFKLNKYGIIALFEKGGKPLNQERTYLVRLFLEQAVLAIQNVGLEEKVLRQEQLSAVGEATSMIVHDLRNSIGMIETIIDMIIKKLDDEESILNFLELIKTAAKNGMFLAQDILDFASDKNTEKDSLSASGLVNDVLEKVKPICEKKGIKLNLKSADTIIFKGDYGKLSRMLLNLINNAIESFADGNASEPEINLSLFRDNGNVSIILADNGPGIPEKIQDSLFTPFATFGKSGGTGLGLAISKQIVEAHNGSINVKSSPEGTEFKIIIPEK